VRGKIANVQPCYQFKLYPTLVLSASFMLPTRKEIFLLDYDFNMLAVSLIHIGHQIVKGAILQLVISKSFSP
jgi:hypothetical protein